MNPEAISQLFDRFADVILRYAVALAGTGTLAMALIEMIKSVSSLRDRFHKQRVRNWIRNTNPRLLEKACAKINRSWPQEDAIFGETVYVQLIELTTGEIVRAAHMDKGIEWWPWIVSSGNALFALELDKMLGQIQDAADMALGNPDVYPELYLFLTAGADLEDVGRWQSWAQSPPVSTKVDAKEAKEQADTYARLRQFIRRRLDSLQLTAGYFWQTINQIASASLGAIMLFVALVILDKGKTNWLFLAVVSVVGGVIAPVAKDLVMALKRMRGNG